ncbi:MAG: hypothetical protein IKI28_03670 [Bacteroidales bacterium]|nr:hypothetical protein [Bacteroidales bacterium]
MDKLNLNSYGVKEMNRSEQMNCNGGKLFKLVPNFELIRKAFQGIVEDNKNNPYGQK